MEEGQWRTNVMEEKGGAQRGGHCPSMGSDVAWGFLRRPRIPRTERRSAEAVAEISQVSSPLGTKATCDLHSFSDS